MARDVIKLTDDDYEGANRKAAPSGTYLATISAKSEIRQGDKGNYINIQASVAKGPHKGVTFWDTISAAVAWKVAQLLSALGEKKVKQVTLQDLLKMVKGEKLRVILRTEEYEGTKRNKVVQWLPVDGPTSPDEDDEEDGDEDEPKKGRSTSRDDEDEDDDPKPRRNKKDEDEDEDDDPADDDEDEPKKGRKSRDDDEDDDDPPAKRRSKKDEDEDEDDDPPPAKKRRR